MLHDMACGLSLMTDCRQSVGHCTNIRRHAECFQGEDSYEAEEKIEKEDVIFIVLEKLNEKMPMDDIPRSLVAQLV